MIRVHPTKDPTAWWQGRALTVEDKDGVRALVAYDQNLEGLQLAFHVEVTNDAAPDVMVDPARFYYQLCKPSADGTETCSSARNVLNPEAKLWQMEVAENRRQHRAAAAHHAGVGVAAALLLTVVAVAAASEGGSDEQKQASERTHPAAEAVATGVFVADQHMRDTTEHEHIEHAERAAHYDQLDFWRRYPLRKSTLGNGVAVAGAVIVPTERDTKYIRLYLPVGARWFHFAFEQTLYDYARERTQSTHGSSRGSPKAAY